MRYNFTTRAAIKTKYFLRQLRQNTQGVAAVEFAMIAPMMMAMLIGSIELSSALTINRRIPIIASSVADLISRTDRVDNNDLYFMTDKIARSLLEPFDFTPFTINIMSIKADINDATNTTVDWSRAYSAGDADMLTTTPDYAPGADYDMPVGLMAAGTTLIVVEVTYGYTPLVFSSESAVTKMTTTGPEATVAAYEMEHVQYVSPREHLCVSLNNTNCVTGNPF